MKLLEPIIINKLTLRNRIVMPPMATGKAVGGMPDDDLVSYYEARANATGLIIVEHEYVSREGMAHSTQLSMADDQVIPAYRKLTDAVHKHGASIFAQISHAGALAQDSGLMALSPSGISIWDKVDSVNIKEMDDADIENVIKAFASAAAGARKAGFDGIEIHGAHGYLLNQFYSPLTNRRSDAYSGASLAGRTKLQCGILRAVRDTVGADCPVAIRFGAYDYMDGGSMKEDIPEACRLFAAAGADLIDISGGMNGFMVKGNTQPGWFSELSRLAKSGSDVPVIVTGGIRVAEDAEAILLQGDADMIGVGRAMLRDPAWAEHI